MQGMPQGFTSAIAVRPAPERGTALTVYLGLITLGGFVGLAFWLLAFAALKRAPVEDPDLVTSSVIASAQAIKMVGFMILLSATQLACAYGIWTWKKWGILGYLGINVLGILIAIKGGHGGGLSLVSMMMMGFLSRTAVQKWSYFE